MSTEMIAYAAGFFDGEGNIQIVRQRAKETKWGHYYTVRISASQVYDARPLTILEDLFGGRCKEVANGSCTWLASSGPSREALTQMLPYLTVKRAQAALALAFLERRSRTTERNGRFTQRTDKEESRDRADFDEMKRLKKVYY